MKTFHVHLKVKNLEESIDFYNSLFDQEANIRKLDYAKWILNDPKINFAISTGHTRLGIEHLGLQTENTEELQTVFARMKKAKGKLLEVGKTTCCYSKSQKSWITDPQGVNWEAFYTFGSATVYGEGVHASPAPETMINWEDSNHPLSNVTKKQSSDCTSSCKV